MSVPRISRSRSHHHPIATAGKRAERRPCLPIANQIVTTRPTIRGRHEGLETSANRRHVLCQAVLGKHSHRVTVLEQTPSQLELGRNVATPLPQNEQESTGLRSRRRAQSWRRAYSQLRPSANPWRTPQSANRVWQRPRRVVRALHRAGGRLARPPAHRSRAEHCGEAVDYNSALFFPDGKQVLFISDRTGHNETHMAANAGFDRADRDRTYRAPPITLFRTRHGGRQAPTPSSFAHASRLIRACPSEARRPTDGRGLRTIRATPQSSAKAANTTSSTVVSPHGLGAGSGVP